MKTEIRKILSLGNFFMFKNRINQKLVYNLKPSSRIIMHNIHMSWLRSINLKAHSHFPVYLSCLNRKPADPCYGLIEKTFTSYPNTMEVDEDVDNSTLENNFKLKLNLIIPKQDVMQYFFQWQRYRKYWWSSITTTPSLLAVDDMKYESKTIDTQIVANFSCGQKIVEYLSINNENNDSEDTSHITCCMSLETALISLLLDGLLNQTRDGYLRLHSKMAPYKIAFAINSLDVEKAGTLRELAMLLDNQLRLAKIMTWLPNFSRPLQSQIEENLKIGVPYTAILNNETTSNGIFHLLNSSTMLKEQVHIADFEKYAQLLCSK